MGAVAAEAGTVVSAVMLGAVAGQRAVSVSRARTTKPWCARGGKGAEASLRGFARAFELVSRMACVMPDFDPASTSAREDGLRVEPAMTPPYSTSRRRSTTCWPSAMPACWSTRARLTPKLYLERLQQVLQAERAADPAGVTEFRHHA